MTDKPMSAEQLIDTMDADWSDAALKLRAWESTIRADAAFATLTALAASQARVEELTDALNEDALVLADVSRRIARLREALTDLIGAVVAEVNDPQKGGSGHLLARLSDARAALAEPVAPTAEEGRG